MWVFEVREEFERWAGLHQRLEWEVGGEDDSFKEV